MFIEDERINRFLAVGGQKDLNVELHCELLHETCELYKEFGVDCILEFIDEQHAAADASAEQSNLKNTPHTIAESSQVGGLCKTFVTYQKPVKLVCQFDVLHSWIHAPSDEVNYTPLRAAFEAFFVSTCQDVGMIG